jgi:hypothetical protein
MFDSSSLTRSIHQDVARITGGAAYSVSLTALTKNLGTGQARVAVYWKAGEIVVAQDALRLDRGSQACRPYAAVFPAPARATHARIALELGPVTDGQPRNDAEVWYDAVALSRSP